jgi:hypothetical protein
MSKIRFILEKSWGEVSHPGILEVPEGKSIEEIPKSHFEELIKSKGRGAVIKALENLVRWNKSKKPSLSNWAAGMVNSLKEKE